MLSTRELSQSDLAGIQEINDLTYDGHDYIAAAFPDWMCRQGKDLWTIACSDSEGVTGLEVLTLYDQGRTGWIDALRVHPRARGNGIGLALQQQLIEFARGSLPLQRVRLCTARSVVASRKIATSCGMKLHASWGLCFISSSNITADPDQASSAKHAITDRLLAAYMDRLQACATGNSVYTVSEFGGSSVQLLHILRETLSVTYLLQFWKVHELNLEAIESVLADPHHQSPRVGLDPQTGDVCSVSWAYLREDHTGMCAFVTIYGEGFERFQAHVMEELQQAVRAGATTAMLFYNDMSYEPELHEFGLTQRVQTTLDGDCAVAQTVMSFELDLN